MKFSALVVLICCCYLYCVECYKFFSDETMYMGSRCNRSDGVPGTCTKAFQCPEDRFFPTLRDTCSFEQAIPIVCCEHPYGSPPIQEEENIFSQMCRYFNGQEEAHHNESVNESKPSMWPTIPLESPTLGSVGWTLEDGTIEWKCEGALIHPFYVATSADCGEQNAKSPDVVRFHIKAWDIPKYDEVKFSVQKVFVHPSYNNESLYNNIALLRVRENKYNVNFFGRFPVRPLCLWTERTLPVTELSISEEDSDLETMSITKDLRVVPNEICALHHKGSSQLERGVLPTQLCAYDPEGRREICKRTPGSPVFFKQNNTAYLAGITNPGHGCTEHKPAVFVRIYSYLDWIEKIIFRT